MACWQRTSCSFRSLQCPGCSRASNRKKEKEREGRAAAQRREEQALRNKRQYKKREGSDLGSDGMPLAMDPILDGSHHQCACAACQSLGSGGRWLLEEVSHTLLPFPFAFAFARPAHPPTAMGCLCCWADNRPHCVNVAWAGQGRGLCSLEGKAARRNADGIIRGMSQNSNERAS